MPLADLLEAIEVEAYEELARREQEARAEAEQILARAGREAAALTASLADAAGSAAGAEAESTLAVARLEALATLRESREAAFGEVLARVRETVAAARSRPDYSELMRALLAESRLALPAATVLRVDPRDASLAAELAGTLRVEPVLETWGGLELASDDGRAVRNTLERRLANADFLLRRRFAAAVNIQEREAVAT